MGIIKYPGGKEKELPLIRQYLPQHINNYYEPFVGGGAVYLDIFANKYFINDKSKSLMSLYECIKFQNEEFFTLLSTVNDLWKKLDTFVSDQCAYLYEIYNFYKNEIITEEELLQKMDLFFVQYNSDIVLLVGNLDVNYTFVFTKTLKKTCKRKFLRMKVLEKTKRKLPEEDIRKNILGCFKASFYTFIRELYNHPLKHSNAFNAVTYVFMRDMCYSGMFRFNDKGEFNVPYGGISYNHKNYDGTLKKFKNQSLLNRLSNTVLGCDDYLDFLNVYVPEKDDFMFIDPPYDSEFSTYDGNIFDLNSQKNLANFLINNCNCNFMIDIKYTDFISNLYPLGKICKNGNPIKIIYFDKKYFVSFMNRNDKTAEHMLIMNY